MPSNRRPDRLLVPAEVAADLRVSQMTVNRLMHSGDLPAARVGHLWRAWESAYREYLVWAGLSPEIAFTRELPGEPWLLTVEEVADRLRVCKMTVYRMIRQAGQLSALDVSNSSRGIYRIPIADYNDYLQKTGLADLAAPR